MSQIVPVPYRQTFDGLGLPQNTCCIDHGLIGACERNCQMHLHGSADDVADRAQDAVHLPECTETIAINQRQALRLLQQFVVAHENPPARVRGQHDRFLIRRLPDSYRGDANISDHNLAMNKTERRFQ